MELHYWEKQLILYTKHHFRRIDYDKDLKRFPAEMYGLSLEHVESYSVLGMVVRLYQKLADNGHINFKLESFISDIFKRTWREKGKSEVEYDDILRQMLAEFQNMPVYQNDVKVLDLGEVDQDMKADIMKEIEMEVLKQ
jgi:hypothetical protein